MRTFQVNYNSKRAYLAVATEASRWWEPSSSSPWMWIQNIYTGVLKTKGRGYATRSHSTHVLHPTSQLTRLAVFHLKRKATYLMNRYRPKGSLPPWQGQCVTQGEGGVYPAGLNAPIITVRGAFESVQAKLLSGRWDTSPTHLAPHSSTSDWSNTIVGDQDFWGKEKICVSKRCWCCGC